MRADCISTEREAGIIPCLELVVLHKAVDGLLDRQVRIGNLAPVRRAKERRPLFAETSQGICTEVDPFRPAVIHLSVPKVLYLPGRVHEIACERSPPSVDLGEKGHGAERMAGSREDE